MIRALVEQTFDQYKKYFVLAGSSQDTKPTAGVVTGSKFLEVDTGTEYAFDEASNEWIALGLTPEEAKAAIADEVSDWLDAHPEATTTVEDGAITYAKLDASLQGSVDDVSSLKSALNESSIDHSALIANTYIKHADGTTGGNASWLKCTDYISVVPGSVIFLSLGSNPGTIADIIGLAFYNKDKHFVSGIDYTSLPIRANVPSTAYYIRFSIPVASLFDCYYKNIVDIASLNNDIASLNNDIVAVKRIVNLVYINDSYIGADGTIVSAPHFRRTEPFQLKKGDVVRIDAKGYTNYLVVLARYTGSAYAPLIVSDSMDQKVYTYSINTDGYYACSFQTTGYFELSVTIYSSDLSDRISTLEESGASEYIESPIMTNGKYVNLNGSESAVAWGSVTDYLSVDGLKSFYTALRPNISVCYYDKNKVFISGFDAQTVPTVGTWYNAELPQGAKYIRISTYSTIVPQVYAKYSIVDTLVEHDKRLTALESGGERESNILSMYDTFIFIGDSLTWSQVYTSDTDQRRAYKTYPQVFASLCDGESYAFATPGDTALLWWQRSSAGAFDRHGLYIVFLGTNMELTDTIDTDCPGTDPDEFAQTQTGQYGRILQIISNNGDHAVLIKPWGGGGGNLPGTRAVIDAFAEKYNFATIDITSTDRTTPAYHYWPNKEGSNGLHFNELGYAWLANEVFALINSLPAEDKFKIMRTQ